MSHLGANVFDNSGDLLTAVDIYANVSVGSGQNAAKQLEYGDIQFWDVSRVDNMDGLFGEPGSGDCPENLNARARLNYRIGLWDTSRVTSMSSMFSRAAVDSRRQSASACTSNSVQRKPAMMIILMIRQNQ